MEAASVSIEFPADLPISQRRDDIARAISEHQVVIVAGETGSGKTTQLPKICLALGRTKIGHTQPRRIAARSVAERIAEELGSEIGDLVGYQVRFTDRTSAASKIKVMTDGILLAELSRDRDLKKYDTIIIDEAHERSLNIDFLLGYLKRLLPRRPDLKVIVTSATIDTQRFSDHFSDERGVGAPVIEVSGRTYPVEVRYRPLIALPDDEDGEPVVRDMTEAIVEAVRELSAEGPGDVLVFLPGEREIRDAADALTAAALAVEVLPLFSRLSAAEQHRVFSSHKGRRVVLSTNVAETSLTVPGIRYVVDSGLARISRYSVRTKVQRLPIEPISQASANQRSGRCGRVEAGVAIRLYAEDDFGARPAFTEPEILRTNLASVMLQMAWLRLGDLGRFPFVEAPDRKQVASAEQLLGELRAVRPDGRGLTEIGRRLARLPIDPRMGRMILEADRLGCVREVLVIAAALSLQDPRERPSEDRPAERAAAEQLHARFRDPTSDFLTWLNLWRHLQTQQKELSSSAFRRMCVREHLNYLRVREWQDFESQIRQVTKEIGVKVGRPADEPDSDGIHQALLSGLLSHIGLLDEKSVPSASDRARAKRPGPREYLGARGTKFAIFPGSALARKNPTFLMSAELVETSRLWARQNAAIKPEWAEGLAGDLARRSYSEPHWSTRRGSVMAYERVLLYGVPLAADRLVAFGKIDPVLSRELFIRHALVQGEWRTRHPFLARNQQMLEEAQDLEHRSRRRDIVVDEQTLFDFYDARIGASVVSGAHFDQWWKGQPKQLLDFDPAMLVRDDVSDTDFPAVWDNGPLTFDLSYHFEPGAPADGLTIDVPLATLSQVDDGDFSWHVPGLREELVTSLIRSLPKPLRVNFVPAPDKARQFLAEVPAGSEPLLDALERWGRARTGTHVRREDWDLSRIPDHLQPTYRVVAEDGSVAATGKDLDALKAPLQPTFARAVAAVAGESGLAYAGQRSWVFGDIPETVVAKRAGHEVITYPCLVDEGSTVGLTVVGTSVEADARHRRGVARLVSIIAPDPAKRVRDGLDAASKLTLAVSPYASVADLVRDCWMAVVQEAVDASPPVRKSAELDAVVDSLGDGVQATQAVVTQVVRALEIWRGVDRLLTGRAELAHLPALQDMRAQVARLIFPGFIHEARLSRYPTYLKAVEVRHSKLGALAADRQAMDAIASIENAYLHRVAALPDGCPPDTVLRRVRWLLEEYRVQLFAQNLGTAEKVSDARIRSALDA
ncbi:ATP-dependent helicase [Nocardioides baekrokdamisoli]|uniref:ATP-dependent helicase n=1 Tax=Nocardioides baekrokdamisoli TaxID=1804624 RepID=A0A3G9IHV8_9ACTN|nr:ATP-dependent RNA helicase HrpA [Nocardioides baekrokdamisoli]BBH17936.1 ATP-dependent helicase [Nocardioides baekrokdamisoli]